jgi:4-methyl-5(b-hydroxyethyl)-thiazole monophosphate biosynthesis
MHMPEALVFLVNGFEEIEALAVVDILRRGGVDVAMVSLTGSYEVTGSHAISVLADCLFPEYEADRDTVFILPGGPGTPNYKKHGAFIHALRAHFALNGRFAAICAAPGVLGSLGFLTGVRACCYPGHEAGLTGASIGAGPVEVDGNIVTGQSAGASMLFGLAVLKGIKGEDIANMVRAQMKIT